MKSVVIRGEEFDSMAAVHDYLADNLSFPEYYGKNLSALYDVLTEEDQETRIEIDFENMQDQEMIRSLERMVDVISDATAENELLELTVLEI